MATRTIRLSLPLPERDVTRTVVMSENSSIDMLRIVTCIAFGWEYYRGYVTVDGAVHPPMESDTPLKEILGHETYVSPVAGDGIRVRVEFGEESDVPADKCPSIVGWVGEMPDLSGSGIEVYRSGAEAMNPRSLAARLRHARDYDNPYAMVPDRRVSPRPRCISWRSSSRMWSRRLSAPSPSPPTSTSWT